MACTEPVGLIEKVSAGSIVGWAYDDLNPEKALSIDICAAGAVIGSGLADIMRDDLRNAGIGRGRHGFSIPVMVPFNSGQQVDIELLESGTGRTIAAVAFTMHCRDPSAVQPDELDGRSAHGQKPVRKSWQRRKLQSVASPVLKPIRRVRSHFASKQDQPLPAGVQAKLTIVDNMSLTARDKADQWPKLALPRHENDKSSRPDVSVIIPAHNQFQLTYQCLVSLILSGDKANFEVLVVDDASTDATASIETCVDNLRVVRNAENLGFLHSCNKAAAESQGDYIVFLNNDTEVESGWIDSLLDVFNRFNGTGAVGAKLIYPDGTLQDAGGIVWNTGQPWNVGHGKHRDDPEFNYVREVDYLTGAALMVGRSAWEKVGGFSETYAPAYYEDTDLAFKLRAAGYRTLYCPQAAVVHYEGRSNGTDTSSGVKHYQVVNADHFKATWKQQFEHLGAEGHDLRREKDRNRGLRVLMVDNSFPRLGQDAGSYAAIQEMQLLLALGCKVTFLPNNLLHLGKHVEYLQRLGVECVHSPFHRSVAKFMERRAAEFDAVYVTRYAVAEKIIPLVRQFSSARIIFNNADLHFLREFRTALAAGEKDLSAVTTTRQRELAVMESADAVLSYSDIELEIIASHLFASDKLFRCPWVLEAEPDGKPREQRAGLAFLGGYAHPPNRAAMDWFIEKVMPELHVRRPELTLHVWGSHVPEGNGWESQPGVVLEGYAQTLDDVFNSAFAFVAPLQAGAGIKGKVLDSLAYGVPTILSPIAAEATGLIDGSSTLIAHTPDQWIEHIENLLDSAELWERLRTNSIALREAQYSKAAGVNAMHQVLDFLNLDTTIVHQQVAS